MTRKQQIYCALENVLFFFSRYNPTKKSFETILDECLADAYNRIPCHTYKRIQKGNVDGVKAELLAAYQTLPMIQTQAERYDESEVIDLELSPTDDEMDFEDDIEWDWSEDEE